MCAFFSPSDSPIIQKTTTTVRSGTSVQSIERRKAILEFLEEAGGILDAFVMKAQLVEKEQKVAYSTGQTFFTMDRKTFLRLVASLEQSEQLKQFHTTIPMHSGAPKQLSVSDSPRQSSMNSRFLLFQSTLGRVLKFSGT